MSAVLAVNRAAETLQRAQSATGADARPFVARRMAEATEALSRVGLAAAAAELCNAALQRLAELCYACDADGSTPNVGFTGRIEIPVPMGRAGYRYYGLRRLESDVLRAVLVARMDRADVPALFTYNADDRRWYINLAAYPTPKAAQTYLSRDAVGQREYRRHHNRIKASRTVST